MTKKLIGLLAVALFSIATINAAPCTLSNGPVSANGPGSPPIAGTTPSYTCTFSIPAADTLGSVALTLNNGYLQGNAGNNTVQFTYSVSGFAGTTGLTDTVAGLSTDISGGVSPTIGGITGQTPASDCVAAIVVVTCTTNSFSGAGVTAGGFTTYSFTVTGSATWLAGGLQNSGSDAFSAFVSDTYNAPAPEPGTFLMIGGGLIGLVVAGRRKFRA